MLVDHLVERLDVEAWSARRRRVVESLAREPPELTLKNLSVRLGAASPVGARYRLREADARVRVAPQQIERRRSDGLSEGLSAQIRRPDPVRVLDDRRPPRLVASDRERKPEGEDQADDAEQRCLEGGERLSQRLRPVP
ncbi:MAG TPA: hypothetical protein VE440_05475 [Gaiellaceae bacterium]|nr:hypothetical protein [Gaiellaceae bacterium]